MRLPIRQLGIAGVNADRPAFDLQLNEFSSVNNCVFRHGRVQKSAGWFATDFNGDTDPGEDLFWFQAYQSSGTVRTAFFSGDSILIWDGSTLTTSTLTTGTITPQVQPDWNTEIFGQYITAANGIDDPLYSFGDGALWNKLDGWNAAGAPNQPCTVLRSFKSLLFAMGFSSSPNKLAWSDIGKLGNFPANWDSTDTGSYAGTLELQANDGDIVDAANLGDYLIVYTQFACYAVSFTGSIQNPITVRRLFSWGLAAPECVKAYENLHFCIDDQVIYVHDGSNIRRIADNRVEEYFFGQVSDISRTKVALNPEEHEVIVYYPTEADTAGGQPPTPNMIMTWNWLEDIFSFENPGVHLNCIKASEAPGGVITWDDLDTLGWSWQYLDDNGITWADLDGSSNAIGVFQLTGVDRPAPAAPVEVRSWSQREVGTNRNGVEYFASVERLYIDLDEVSQTTNMIHEITQVMPQWTTASTGTPTPVYFQLGYADAPNQPITWTAVREWTFGSQRQLDYRTQGRYLSWRAGIWLGVTPEIGTNPPPGNWKLSGMDIDVIQDGER